MRHYILIAAAAGMTVQLSTPLPMPVQQSAQDRALGVVGRLASTGCAVDAPAARAGVWSPATFESGGRGTLADVRQGNRQMRDRCVPRRKCFTSQSPIRARRGLGSRFRAPTFLGT